MIRMMLLALVLATGFPAQADEASDAAEAAARAKLEARRHDLQTQIDDKNTRKTQLEKERDAARVNANVYVLPKYKLEVEGKQKEIDAVDAELDLLKKQLEDLAN